MKRRINRRNLLLTTPLYLLIALSLIGISYGYWTDTLKIKSSIKTGSWSIQEIGAGLIKQVDGIYCNDPTPGCEPCDTCWSCSPCPPCPPCNEDAYGLEHLGTTIWLYPTDEKVQEASGDFFPHYPGGSTVPVIWISHDNDVSVPQWFKLTLTVVNHGDFDITDIQVWDYISKKQLPLFIDYGSGIEGITGSPQDTGNGFAQVTGDSDDGYMVYWEIISIAPGSSASLDVWISTTPLKNKLKFHPTSGDNSGEDDIPLNYYAEFGFDYELDGVIHTVPVDENTRTGAIHFMSKGDGVEDNWGYLWLYDGTGDIDDITNYEPFNWPAIETVDVYPSPP